MHKKKRLRERRREIHKRKVQRGDRVRTEAGRTNKGFWEEVL